MSQQPSDPTPRSREPICEVSALKNACSLPGTLLRILETLDDEQSTRLTVARVIGGDPDLTERVLSAANSPLYLTYNDRIDDAPPTVSNLPTAILKIGFAGIRNIAFSQGLCTLARGGHELGVQIVVHLLVVAELARAIGAMHARSLGEDAYFCGLVHDIGKLALLRTLPLEYLRVAASCRARRCHALQAEDALLAPAQPFLVNHIRTGVELLKAHGIPTVAISAVEAHHDDPLLRAEAGGAWDLAWIVAVANQLAYQLGYSDGLSETNPVYLSTHELITLLEVDCERLDQLVQETIGRVNDAMTAARLPVKPRVLRRIREMELTDRPSAPEREEVPRAADESYGAGLTLIDLARTRTSVGFHDFKVQSGLADAELTKYLEVLTEGGYLRSVPSRGGQVTYSATTRLHRERPHDILRKLLLDHGAA